MLRNTFNLIKTHPSSTSSYKVEICNNEQDSTTISIVLSKSDTIRLNKFLIANKITTDELLTILIKELIGNNNKTKLRKPLFAKLIRELVSYRRFKLNYKVR